MDRASQVLARGVPPGLPQSYRALADHGRVPRSTLHARAHDRQSMQKKAERQQYLTPSEDKALVDYFLHMANMGYPVRMKHVPDIAFRATQHRSASERPPKPPGKNWAKSFEGRHPELQARRVMSMDWKRHDKNIYEKTVHWFEVIEKVLKDPAVRAENVYNFDETGIMLAKLNAVKVLVGKDDPRGYRGTLTKREMVTSIECISADGRYLNPMIIWPATTHRSNWTTFPTPGWQYACSETGYTDSYISLEWLKHSFDPQTKELADHKPRVLICDGFGTHETLEILEFCFENNIILCRIPSHTSHKLQPCDVAVFSPLKTAYREQVERLERGGVNAIGKEHFTTLYSAARERAFTRKNILAGFAACGLFPFNPERVLRDMVKPLTDVVESTSAKVTVDAPCQRSLPLGTPATPVSAEAFAALQDQIIKQNANTLDRTSQQRLQKYLEKMVKGAQTACASGVLLQDQIRFLTTINNEAKTRRSTRSDILGKGRRMTYEDLEQARIKRKEKEDAKKAKGSSQRGGKRKAVISVVDMPEPQAKTWEVDEEPDVLVNALADALADPAPEVILQMGGTLGIEDTVVATPFRAPVARMW